MLASAQQNRADGASALLGGGIQQYFAPPLTLKTTGILAQKIQNNAKVVAALAVVIDKYNLFFFPHGFLIPRYRRNATASIAHYLYLSYVQTTASEL